MAAQDKQPGLVLRPNRPLRAWNSIDLFKDEVGGGDEKRSSRFESLREGTSRRPPGIGDRDGLFNVQRTRSSIIKETKGCVAALLDFGDHETGSDGVNGASRNIDDIATRNLSPSDPLGNRSVRDGLAELLRSQRSVETESNAAPGFCGKDVPRLGLAARFAHRSGERVSRMNLDRQRLEREKQFQEQRWLVGRGVPPFVPDLANLPVCSADVAPWPEIAAAPGLFDCSRRGKFYRHGPLLVRVCRRGSTHRRALAKSRRMAPHMSVQRGQRGGLRTGCC